MATLTNTKIKDTYDGLLKTTNNEAIAASGVTLIEDGLGNASALSVGRSGNGVSVSGLLDVSGEVQGTSLDINGAADISGNLAVDTNTLYVDAANNRVGIGTSTPNVAMQINQASSAPLLIHRPNNTAFDPHGIVFSTRGDAVDGGLDDARSGIFSDYNGDIFLAAAQTGITGSPETYARLFIDGANGNVGIGTQSPADKIHAYNASGNTFGFIQSAASGVAGLKLQSAAGLSTIYTGGGSAQGFQFYANGSTESMRITSGGDLLLGKIGLSAGTVGFEVEPNGVARITKSEDFPLLLNRLTSEGAIVSIRYNSSPVGSISVTSSATAYNTSSDYRLKEDWQPIANALERVDELKPINFAWKADGSRVDGFLAHEVAEVIPEAITGEKDAVDEEGNPIYQGIDQSKIVPLLVGAIQELKAEIELLKSQING